MNYVVMDLEWNQPVVAKKQFRGLYGEIIQIGAIKVDSNLNEIGRFNEIVKPFYYKKMNKDVSELTGIKQEDLDKATLTFSQAIDKFKEFVGDDSIFITWSFTDISMLLNNLEMFELDDSWVPDNYDAQLMFDDQVTMEDRSFPLNYALYYFKEKPESSHDALDDSLSVIKILKHLNLDEGLIDDFKY